MKTISKDSLIKLPDKFKCPICDAALDMEIDEWEQNDDGTWQASECGVHCNCTTEPDIDSDEWKDWHRGHWSMPYVDWLPVDAKVYRWLSRHYRFAVETETA